jgi:hypothetical protein
MCSKSGDPGPTFMSKNTGIATLNARRCGSTGRARSGWGGRTQGQCDLLTHLDLLHLDLGKVWNDDDTVQLMPRRKGKLEKMFNFSVYHILDQQGCVTTTFCVPFWGFSSTSVTNPWMVSDPRLWESCTRLLPDLNEWSRSLRLSQRLSCHRRG